MAAKKGKKPAKKRKPAAGRPKKPAKKPRAPRRKLGAVEAAVKRDLASLEARRRADPAGNHSDLSKSGLAESALVLARELDDRETSATAKASCARALLATLEQLRELAGFAPEKGKGGDGIDELSARRAARLASGGSKT